MDTSRNDSSSQIFNQIISDEKVSSRYASAVPQPRLHTKTPTQINFTINLNDLNGSISEDSDE